MHTFNKYLINDKISLDVISLDVICEVHLFYKKDFLLAKNIGKMFHWQKAPRKIYLLYFKKGKSFWKKIFAGINCRDRSFPARSCFFVYLSRHLISATFVFFETKFFSHIFLYKVWQWTFLDLSTFHIFVTFWVFERAVLKNSKIFVQLIAYLDEFFFPFSCSRLKIPATFWFCDSCDTSSYDIFLP